MMRFNAHYYKLFGLSFVVFSLLLTSLFMLATVGGTLPKPDKAQFLRLIWIILGVGSFAGFLMVLLGSRRYFLIVNKAEEPIVCVSLVIYGRTIMLKNIRPNTEKKGTYKVIGNEAMTEGDHYPCPISVEFLSGKKLQKILQLKNEDFTSNKSVGYHLYEITITSSDINVTDSRSV